MRHVMGFALLVSCMLFVSGCVHDLSVENIGAYTNTRFEPLGKPLKLGIITDAATMEEKHLITNISDTLMEYSVQPVMQQSLATKVDVDAIASIDIKSEHDGSGTNFWINWPGFLIFAPSWNGYIYEVKYRFNVKLSNPENKKLIDEFTVPVTLDIRHANINRTWTEISWFEVSAIALIGGFVFISYDDSVTPLLIDKYGQTIGRYVAKNIINHLKSKGGFARDERLQDTFFAVLAAQ